MVTRLLKANGPLLDFEHLHTIVFKLEGRLAPAYFIEYQAHCGRNVGTTLTAGNTERASNTVGYSLGNPNHFAEILCALQCGRRYGPHEHQSRPLTKDDIPVPREPGERLVLELSPTRYANAFLNCASLRSDLALRRFRIMVLLKWNAAAQEHWST